jgi:primosomal protein N''
VAFKKLIEDEIGMIDPYSDLNGPIDKLLARIQEIREAHPGHRDLRLSTFGDEGIEEVLVWGTRQETDAEFELRLKKIESARKSNKGRAAKKLEEERALYDKLKKKFEPKGTR